MTLSRAAEELPVVVFGSADFCSMANCTNHLCVSSQNMCGPCRQFCSQESRLWLSGCVITVDTFPWGAREVRPLKHMRELQAARAEYLPLFSRHRQLPVPLGVGRPLTPVVTLPAALLRRTLS
jgi:hypothetical protein